MSFFTVAREREYEFLGPGKGSIELPIYIDKWAVTLPHRCDEWEVTGSYDDYESYGYVPHEQAVRDLERFIQEAQEALIALTLRQELSNEEDA